MSEIVETFDAMRDESMERRRRNREGSAELLRDNGIAFESGNAGAHLMLTRPDGGRIDFWPGTGKWIDTVSKAEKRGVRPLLAHLRSLRQVGKSGGRRPDNWRPR